MGGDSSKPDDPSRFSCARSRKETPPPTPPKKEAPSAAPKAAMPDPNVKLSKGLSQLLRHSAIEAGVPISEDGWVKVSDALAHVGKGKFTVDDVRSVVEGNDKQRFSLRELSLIHI